MADVDRAVEAVRDQSPGFCVLADVRDLVVLTDDAARELGRLTVATKESGHDRTAAVVDAATLKLQLRRPSRESRGDQSFRFFEPDDHDDWHRAAVDWLRGADG